MALEPKLFLSSLGISFAEDSSGLSPRPTEEKQVVGRVKLENFTIYSASKQQ